MRTIKFRGKVFPQNKWLYGDLLTSDDFKVAVIRDHNSCVEQRVDADTVGQFTGLLDCNGKEIYEGDVIESMNGFRRKVAFVEDAASPMLIWLNDEDIDSPKTISCNFIRKYGYRVIGNIHDNPELLSKSK
jgi:uncharacterized phage protein (TIGR01671 family)